LKYQEDTGKAVGAIVVVLILLALAGPCTSSDRPAIDPRIVGKQLELINGSLEVLQEEVAAAQSPSRWSFALFIVSILAPLGAAVWMLWRSEKSAIGHDTVIRAMVRSGFKESVVNAYLMESVKRPQLPAPLSSGHPINAPIRRGRRRSRHRRRWREKNEDDS